MSRPRDSQQSKVYKAERDVFSSVPFGPTLGTPEFRTVAECHAFVNQVIGSRWWVNRAGRIDIEITDGRGSQNAFAYRLPDHKDSVPHLRLSLPRWARSRIVILHELAHCITGIKHGYYERDTVPFHGREFCSHLLALVKRWLGPDQARALQAAFKEHRVKYRARTL